MEKKARRQTVTRRRLRPWRPLDLRAIAGWPRPTAGHRRGLHIVGRLWATTKEAVFLEQPRGSLL
eukprot:7890921-Lingulodinium_polyedra.AAC.1